MDFAFEGVTYRYPSSGGAGVNGLYRLTLELMSGEFTIVMGEPGSGKSTLLQHMNGLLRPQEGRVRVMEWELSGSSKSDAAAASALRKRVGLVFQFPEQQLFEETVERELLFGPLNFGASREAAYEQARHAMEQVGLDLALLSSNPFELSGGQQRKAAIAAVLAADPEVLVLDEPTASLDQRSRSELLMMLKELCERHGKTVIVVTHRLEEVMPYADRLVVIRRGEAVYQSSLEKALLAKPELLAEAGIVMPASMQLLHKMAAELDCPLPSRVPDAAEMAAWIVHSLNNQQR